MIVLFNAIKSAKERSKCVPDFFRSEGLRFTVIFKGGKTNSLVSSADLVRSFASCMSLLARPTTENPGRPFVKVASTSMTLALTPSRVAQVNLLTIACFFSFCFTLFTCIVWLFGGRLPLFVFAFIVTVSHKLRKEVKNMSNCNVFLILSDLAGLKNKLK